VRTVIDRNGQATERVVIWSGVIACGVVGSTYETARMGGPGNARVRVRNSGGLGNHKASEIPLYGYPGRVGLRATALARSAANGYREHITSNVATAVEASGEDLLLDTATVMAEAHRRIGDGLQFNGIRG